MSKYHLPGLDAYLAMKVDKSDAAMIEELRGWIYMQSQEIENWRKWFVRVRRFVDEANFLLYEQKENEHDA